MSETLTPKTCGVFDNPANRQIISRLTAQGDDCLLLPSIKTTVVESALSELMLQSTDWILFTDVFAVTHFLELFLNLGHDLFSLDELTIVANGEAVADRLRFSQLHADVIPPRTDPKSCVEAILQYSSENLSETRILVVECQNAVLGLETNLRSSGADCVSLGVYLAEFESPTARPKSLLTGGAVDGVILGSPEDVVSLQMLAGHGNLREFLGDTSVFAVNDDAYQCLRELGLRPLYFQVNK